jgi:aminoglycoside 3-N-acetyltransferase
MALPNTRQSLAADLEALGIQPGLLLMCHASLGQVGWTVGGANTVIQALLDVLGPSGTLCMPAESPFSADPEGWNDKRVKPEWYAEIRQQLPPFDPRTTPTTMGAIAEAFRTYPKTLRSLHPLVSVCARGPLAEAITSEHALDFGEGRNTPFEKLYALGGFTLLLGVGFDRCTSLHFAEALTADRRVMTSRVLVATDGKRQWVDTLQMGIDGGTHFPKIGAAFCEAQSIKKRRVGEADTYFVSTRALVDFAVQYFGGIDREERE